MSPRQATSLLTSEHYLTCFYLSIGFYVLERFADSTYLYKAGSRTRMCESKINVCNPTKFVFCVSGIIKASVVRPTCLLRQKWGLSPYY